jgi:single-strand DNA-binding protein
VDTYLTMQGNLATDPTQKMTASGQRVTKFRIAASGRRFDKGLNDWVNTNPVFMTVTCWRLLGDNVYKCLHKGDTVIVHGRVAYHEYDDTDGKKRSLVQLDAQSVGPDLSRYVVQVSRPNREIEELAPPPDVPAVPAQAAAPAA